MLVGCNGDGGSQVKGGRCWEVVVKLLGIVVPACPLVYTKYGYIRAPLYPSIEIVQFLD